jgi:hypothetical protein
MMDEGRTGAGPWPEPVEPNAPAASWRTMMATFVTRLERDHEALLEALRERLDEAETRSQALESRVAALESRVGAAWQGDDATLRARLAALEAAWRELREATAGAETSASAPAPAPAPSPGPARETTGMAAAERTAAVAAPTPAGAAALAVATGAGPAGASPAGAAPPWHDAAQAMLQREAEVLQRAERGEAPRDIAAALGRGLGEVELVLRLAERAGVGMTGARGGRV